jgi:Protein of unknown function (DUF2865)
MKRLPIAFFQTSTWRAAFFAAFTAIIVIVGSGFDAGAQRFTTDRPEGRHRTENSYCRELERELASDWVQGRQSKNTLPDLNKKVRKQDALFNRLQNKADRMDCYENMFIFGRSLRRTKKCHAIDRKIRTAKKELARLRDKQESIKDSRRGGDRRQRLIEKLARNGCGEQYRYEARRNSPSWFEDSGLGELFGGFQRPRRRSRDNNFAETIQPYATYRTMCVRLCDGYYFPVSFSTLPSSFPRDTDVCQNKCAAPAELYVYRNPGGEVEQMISPNGQPYDSIENAWRYRKEYIKGCSCKQTEYSQSDIDAHNNPQKQATNVARPANKVESGESPAKKPKSDFDKATTIDDLIR